MNASNTLLSLSRIRTNSDVILPQSRVQGLQDRVLCESTEFLVSDTISQSGPGEQEGVKESEKDDFTI